MMWNCHSKNNQAWRYDEGTKAIKSVRDPNKCVDLSGTNSNFQMYDCHGKENQQIHYTKKQGGEYGLLWTARKGTKNCFDVHRGDNDNIYGEEDCDDRGKDQEFYIEERKGKYYPNSYFRVKDSNIAVTARMKYGCYNSHTEEFSEKGELRHSRDITIEKYYCPEDKPLKAVKLIQILAGGNWHQTISTGHFKWVVDFAGYWQKL